MIWGELYCNNCTCYSCVSCHLYRRRELKFLWRFQEWLFKYLQVFLAICFYFLHIDHEFSVYTLSFISFAPIILGGDVVIARQPLENMYLVHSLLLLACCKEAYRGHSSFFWCKLTSLIYFLLSYQGNIENNSLFSSLIFNISYCFRIIVWFLWKWIILECVYLQNFLQPSV